jgi:hypothetical protein
MRPAPQGRAYRERRHFCNVTILLSSDDKIAAGEAKKGAKTVDAKPAKLEESKGRKRGGAVAVPRAKRTVAPKPKSEATETKPASKKSESSGEAPTTEE